MDKIKKVIKSMLNIPTPYIFAVSTISLLVIFLLVQGNVQLSGLLGLILLGVLFYLQIKLGSIVMKSLLSGFMILYVTSLYSYLTMELHGIIVQPFLLTIATVTAFLSVTYISHNLSLRSRPFWSAMLAILVVSVKSAILLVGYSYLMAEVIGLNTFVIFSAIWYFWANNTNKSKLISHIIDEKIDDKFQYVYIDEKINVNDKKWVSTDKKQKNAYPFIYTEVMKAIDKKLTLIIISNVSTDKTYDVGYVKYNTNEIPYLYIEAKSDIYMNDIINQFDKEILRD